MIRLAGALCGLLLGATATAPTLAQEPAGADHPSPELDTIPVGSDEPATGDAADAVQLDDIVVTATKRERSVREIPGIVDVLDGAELEYVGARELKDFAAQVPGLSLQEGRLRNSQRTLAIRGIGPGTRANATVGTLIGDVPVNDPYISMVLPDLDPFDLRGVEVLKGPQGTIFGGAALNGAIRYVPNVPELGAWSGRAFVDRLDVDEGGRATSFGGALNAPLGDEAAVRGVAVVQRIPGVYDNLAREVPDADRGGKWMGRALARWDATERLGINAFYLRQNSGFDDASQADNRDGRLEHSYHPGPSRLEMNFGLASLELRYRLDGATVVSQSARLDKDGLIDADFGEEAALPAGLESLRARAAGDLRSYVQELRLVSPDDGNWRWIGGLYLQDFRANTDFNLYVANTAALPDLGTGFGSPDGVSVVRAQQKPLLVKEYAAFGELTRRLGARWEATAGARVYRTRIDVDVEVSGLTAGGQIQRSLHQREDGVNPKVSLSFRATDDIRAYAAVARGFQFGGVNAVPPTNPIDTIPVTYDSSRLWSYEAGVRTDWLRRTLHADLTLFHIDWSDAQIQQTTPSAPKTTYIDNVGVVRSQGAEGTVTWLLPITGLSLEASATYIDARTAEAYHDENGATVPAGTTMPATPRLQTATTLAFDRPFESWTAGVALVHSHVGKAWSNIEHEHEIYDYELLNLHVSAGLPGVAAAPELALGITNLRDERGLVGRTGSDEPAALTKLASYYNRPRALSLVLRLQF